MAPKTGRGIPKIAVAAVAALVLGVALTVLGLAWKANRESRPAHSGAAASAEAEARVAGDAFTSCTQCHQDLDKVFKAGKAPGLLYRHQEHFAKGVSDCSNCHPANTHEADHINKPTMGRCFMCHGMTQKAIAPGACNTCHPRDWPRKPPTHLAAGWVSSKHGKVAKTDRFECLTCHQEKSCGSCHGLTMPHPEGWKGQPHTTAFFDLGSATCERCHPRAPQIRDFCDSCHHPQGPKKVPWRAYHFEVVESQGASTCFQCHNPTTCASCHVEGKETFQADRTNPLKTPSPPTTER